MTSQEDGLCTSCILLVFVQPEVENHVGQEGRSMRPRIFISLYGEN
jgi:hypothetical protein